MKFRKIPYLNTTAEEDLFYTLIFAFLWWIIGLNILIYHVCSFIIFVKSVRQKKSSNQNLKVPSISSILLLFVFSYTISIIVNFSYSSLDRTIASLYNLSFWVMGFFLIISISNLKLNEIEKKIRKASFINIISIFILLAIGKYFISNQTFRIPTILGSVLQLNSLPDLLKASFTIQFYRLGFLGGEPVIRALVLSPYPTALAGTVALLFFLIQFRGKDKFFFLICVALSSSIVLQTYSRIGNLVFFTLLVASFIGLLLIFVDRGGRAPLFFLLSLVLILIFAIFFDYIESFFLGLNRQRQGSSDLRTILYKYSINLVLRENPFLGLGVKPRSLFPIPLGSHSTYIGIFFKTGILGLSFFVTFQVFLIVRFLKIIFVDQSSIRQYTFKLALTLAVFNVFIFFEDLDAPAFMCFLYFLIIGIIYNQEKEITSSSLSDY